MFAALPLTLFALAVLPPLFGCSSRTSEFELQPYDSLLQGNVDRALSGPAGTIAVTDVESAAILAAKNQCFAGKQLIRPGSAREPFVLMELPDSGKLDPRRRLICPRPLRIGGMRLDCSHTADVSQFDANDAMVAYFPRAAEGMPGSSRTPSPRKIGK